MMQRKKILITIDWFLPGTKSGGPVRSYANMIDHLGDFHDFLIITRDTDYCSDDVYTTITSDSWNQYNDHTSIYYFSKENLTKKNLSTLLNETDYDILYVNGIYSWFFSILPVLLINRKRRIIVSARGMLNSQAFTVKKLKKTLFLSIANAIGFYKKVDFHATNEDEAAQIKSRIKNFNCILIAPNLPRKAEPKIIDKEKHSNATRFVNIARVSIEKGTLKMIEALKTVSTKISLDIYGPIYDTEYWTQCEKSISQMPENIRIEYKGIVASESVPNTLNNYDYFILLSEGENFGHAILEAMSAGCPVIISDQTPWRLLEGKKIGWDIDANDLGITINTIELACRMTNSEYQVWSKNAIEFSLKFSENPELIKQNLNLFSDK